MRDPVSGIQALPVPCVVLQGTESGSFSILEMNPEFSAIFGQDFSTEQIMTEFPELYSAFLSCLSGNTDINISLQSQKRVMNLKSSILGEQCTICLLDISAALLSSRMSEELMQTSAVNADYKHICECMLQLSGAEFCVMNVIEADGRTKRTNAIAGSAVILQQLIADTGRHPLGQINEEAHADNSRHTWRLHKISISHEDLEFGDFILYNSEIQADSRNELVQRLAHQTALMLFHSRTEHELNCFRSIFNNSAYGVVITDLDGKIRFTNNYYAKLHGYRTEDLIGKLVSDNYSDQRGLKERVLHRKGTDALEIWHRHRDGHMFPMMVTGAVIPTDDGLPKDIVLTAIDLSEQYQVELSLQEAIEEARNASIAKSSFLAAMSHELRSPLNSIVGFARLLEPKSPEQEEFTGNIRRSSEILLQLIDDILDFSKIEAGKLELHEDRMELRPFLQDLVDTMYPQAIGRSNRLRLTIDRSIPKMVLADELRIRQILTNLLSNAVKFTEHGSIDLIVEALENNMPGTASVRFSVVDTGIGIANEQQADIFESFVQANPSTSRKYGGTGLGLSISNRLLELMNSKLNLKSEEGKGSRFFFNLAFTVIETANDGLEPIPHYSDHPCVEDGCSMYTVLVVDDDRVNRVLARVLIQRILPGAEIIEAENGAKAIEIFSDQRPDIVLMDIQMPEMDGYDTCRAIRSIEASKYPTEQPHRKSVIIALTAHAMSGEQERCRAAGMNAYSPKPVNEQELQEIILQHTSTSNRL